MATKKSYSRHTNSADRRKGKGATGPSIQQIVKPDHDSGATVPGIQPVPQSPTNDKPSVNTKPSPDSQPSSSNQPSTYKPKRKLQRQSHLNNVQSE